MKKKLRVGIIRGQSKFRLYSACMCQCNCNCSCGSVPSYDWMNVVNDGKTYHGAGSAAVNAKFAT